jgi:hypothetical protein
MPRAWPISWLVAPLAISLRTSSSLGVRSFISPPEEWDSDVLALLVREATTVFINDALNTALPVLTTILMTLSKISHENHSLRSLVGYSTSLSARRITSATSCGCDIMGTCEASTSVIVAPARSAMERTTLAPAALSLIGTTAQEGSFLQAGTPMRAEEAHRKPPPPSRYGAGNAEIVPLEIGALDSRRLLLRAAHVTLRGIVVARHRSRAACTDRARRPRPPINAAT